MMAMNRPVVRYAKGLQLERAQTQRVQFHPAPKKARRNFLYYVKSFYDRRSTGAAIVQRFTDAPLELKWGPADSNSSKQHFRDENYYRVSFTSK